MNAYETGPSKTTALLYFTLILFGVICGICQSILKKVNQLHRLDNFLYLLAYWSPLWDKDF